MDLQLDCAADQRILGALRSGQHRRAAALLVQSYGRDVYRLCRLITSDPDAAEDLVQACFAGAFSALGSFRATGSPGSWLLEQCARRLCAGGPTKLPEAAERIAADRAMEQELAEQRLERLEPGGRRLLGLYLARAADEGMLARLCGLEPDDRHGALVALLDQVAEQIAGPRPRQWGGEPADTVFPRLLVSLRGLRWPVAESLLRRLEVLAAAL